MDHYFLDIQYPLFGPLIDQSSDMDPDTFGSVAPDLDPDVKNHKKKEEADLINTYFTQEMLFFLSDLKKAANH